MKKFGLLLALLPFPLLAFSQTTTTVPGSVPAASLVPAPAQVITLGNSVIPLTGPWKFSPGDSPWVNGSPVWAQPGFDDSEWAAMDLAPNTGLIDPNFGTDGFIPGWTRRGYPNLDGYAWYRLRVRVTDPSKPLWLKMPNNVDDGYQVYVDGRYVGQFGGFSRKNHVTLYYAQPVSFALPALGADGVMDIAVRFYMTPATRFSNPDVGGMHGPPQVGLASTVQLLQRADEDALQHRAFTQFLRTFLFLLILPLALWAWLKNREERAWLWLFLAVGTSFIIGILTTLASMTTKITIASDTLSEVIFLDSVELTLWAMFWWHWFGLEGKRWIVRWLWGMTALGILFELLLNSPYFGLSFVSHKWLDVWNSASVWCGVALGLLLLAILVEGFRRERTEALLAAFPILLLEFTQFQTYLLSTFDIRSFFFPFGLGINIGQMASILMVLVIGVLALRRLLRTQVREELERQVMHQDLEQAQQLQQRVLVPEAMHSTHFTVETEYRPAQTVGGDFFQTLTKPDGSLLVVIGDVSGKGMSAAMLVAVLVGAIRNRAEDSFDPASMLARLNRRLLGRAGGHFATCMVTEIQPNGAMRVANAGHLPPYLNGEEMEMEGSLPLGIAADTEYSVQTFMLNPGDRLTFMTDGVVEATNQSKELFGFERAREISVQNPSAIAQQAQSFGQEDDITVLGVAFA
jgi:hypothetical protein